MYGFFFNYKTFSTFFLKKMRFLPHFSHRTAITVGKNQKKRHFYITCPRRRLLKKNRIFYNHDTRKAGHAS